MRGGAQDALFPPHLKAAQGRCAQLGAPDPRARPHPRSFHPLGQIPEGSGRTREPPSASPAGLGPRGSGAALTAPAPSSAPKITARQPSAPTCLPFFRILNTFRSTPFYASSLFPTILYFFPLLCFSFLNLFSAFFF